ncbi:MAG: hypothetical protein M1840_003962 [Geoglossum simile]|nr:MAG: hypothetical protein M1840_003962 [Geoglossum simile]
MFSRKSKQKSEAAAVAEHSARGAFGMGICHDGEQAVADIVFVHGLAGNPKATWTHKESEVFWPADLLKNDLPKTRIMTFGYDADVAHFWDPASSNRIGNHALNLTNALSQIRERTETVDRPIIFVTHSLGGLVSKDAILASRNSAEPHLKAIFDCTRGICFLGTPHCGSKAANWASIFGKIVDVVKTVNVDILHVLTPSSEVLERIQGDFLKMLRERGDQSLKVTCFFEELSVAEVAIVPRQSAILPAYNAIGIPANHMDMVKFKGPDDSGYLSVSTELLRWTRSIQTASQQSKPTQPLAYPQLNSIQPFPGLHPQARDPYEQQQLAPQSQDYHHIGQPPTDSPSPYPREQPSPYRDHAYSPLPAAPTPWTYGSPYQHLLPYSHGSQYTNPWPRSPHGDPGYWQPPGPRVHQGGNSVTGPTNSGGKSIVGSNISSEGDMTFTM